MNALIAEWLPLFFEPDDVFEVRGLDVERPGRKVAGFVSVKRLPAMIGKIVALAEKASGVYFTPQHLYSNLLTRSPHQLIEVSRRDDGIHPKLTSDDDVIARRFAIIDIDPVKQLEFKKQSATDHEKESAGLVTKNVREYLASMGCRAPLIVDSGNGYHLYYRLDEPQPGGVVADSTTDALAGLLRGLKARFDTPEATIDSTVFNASRIMKIPGTPARKGTPTTDRPHRFSAVLEVPSDW